jgi:hypothetical protein
MNQAALDLKHYRAAHRAVRVAMNHAAHQSFSPSMAVAHLAQVRAEVTERLAAISESGRIKYAPGIAALHSSISIDNGGYR